jgi:hypothetical protein
MADEATSITQRQALGNIHARNNARESESGIAGAAAQVRDRSVAA